MTDSESLNRVRTEFETAFKSRGISYDEFITKDLSLDFCSDLNYLSYVIQEALRLSPVVPLSSPLYFEKDTKIGNIHVKADTSMYINILGLHMNGKQWQRPDEFLPDRFDPSHPLSRTPSGEKRNTFSWLPFNGGKRICFGKTFAEFVIKIILTMVTQRFDMKFVDSQKYHAKSLPVKHMGQTHIPELAVEVTRRASPHVE